MQGLGQHGAWRRLPLLLMLAACWLLAHAWNGLWHDGRLYALQALHRLHPENFRNELFFLYGSQDSFSLFSPLYAVVIALLGLPAAALAMYVLGSVLWLAAAGTLLRRLLKGWAYWLGLACLVLLPTDYGPAKGILTLGEPYPTPRIFAEALSMLALACLLRGAWLRGGLSLALALLLHPLMAAGAALLGLLYLAKGRARTLALAAAAVLTLGLALAAASFGVRPFDSLLASMDPAWLALVERFAFMHVWNGWQAAHWLSRTVLAFSLVLVAARLARGSRARFYGCTALAGGLGLLLSWIGTGLTHNLLLIQVQPWRVLWLVQLVSWVALAWLLATFWRRGGVFRLLLLTLVIAALMRNSIGGYLAVPAAAALCLQRQYLQQLVLPARTVRLLAMLLLAIGGVWLAELLKLATDSGALVADTIEDSAARIWTWTLLLSGAAGLLGAALMWLAWRWSGSVQRGRFALACLLALVSLAAAAALRPGPPDYAHPISAQAWRDAQAAFQPVLPPQAVVYWENDVRGSWFLLQRASYVTSVQLAGLGFNRGTAVEGARRLQRLRQLGVPDAVREFDPSRAKLEIAALPPVSLQGLLFLCRDPVLDFVVLTQDFAVGVVARATDRQFPYTYYLYQCARLRNYNPQSLTNQR